MIPHDFSIFLPRMNFGLVSLHVFSSSGFLCDSFQLKLHCKKQKSIKIFLIYVHLSKIDKVDHGCQLPGLKPPHEKERMHVLVAHLFQQPLEEGTARGQDHFVRLELTILASQGHIN